MKTFYPANINSALLGIARRSYHQAMKRADKNQWLTENELLQLQQTKFLKLIEHAKTTVPYYKILCGDIDISTIEDIIKIPFMTKDIIKNNLIELKSISSSQKWLKSNATSGSTGEAMYFYSDKKTDVDRHACKYRGDSWTGWTFGETVVIIWGAVRDTKKNNSLFGKLINSPFLFNTKMFNSFNMTNEDILYYIDKINKKRPALIVGYPSSLTAFCEFILDNEIHIHSPKGIVTGGESLLEYQRAIIEKTFNTNVLSRYGCREVGHIANECEVQSGLHISMDHIIVEVINENGQPCNFGEIGEIVVTDLDNYAFPFIRYKIGDLGVLSNKKCECGRKFQMLERVVGRTFDIIVGTNGNRVPGTYFTLLKYKLKGISKFQIVQKSIRDIQLKIVINSLYQNSDNELITRLFREKLGNDTLIDIEIVENIPLTEAGKFKWIISEIA